MIKNDRPLVVIVDDFLEDPDAARERALQQEYKQQRSKGVRSLTPFPHEEFRDAFERILSMEITDWDLDMNGRYQYCTSEDPLVYHCDLQTHAASIFLSPDAPPECGLKLLRSKKYGLRYGPTQEEAEAQGMSVNGMFNDMFGGFYDATKWETIDQIGNVYNRLVIWDSKHVHTAACYFGQQIQDSRLFQVFFFNAR